jgi:hypothetical protein
MAVESARGSLPPVLVSVDLPAPRKRLNVRRERTARVSRAAFELRRLDAFPTTRDELPVRRELLRSAAGTPAPESTAAAAAICGSPKVGRTVAAV